mgnify:CR=1 FL=1
MQRLEIKKGKVQDINEISDLYDTVTGYLESHINYPGWKKGIYPARLDGEQAVKEGTLYVARVDGKIVGSLILNEDQENGYDSVTWKTSAEPGEVFVIHTFMVHPDYLKAGIGRFFLQFAEKEAEREGRKVIRLDVSEKNVPAIRLYEHMGYEYVGTADLGYGDFGLPWFKLYEKPVAKGERS